MLAPGQMGSVLPSSPPDLPCASAGAGTSASAGTGKAGLGHAHCAGWFSLAAVRRMRQHEPYQPWSSRATTSPDPCGMCAPGNGVCPALLLFLLHYSCLTGKVRPAWVCQHKPLSGLWVMVWTQPERWTEMPVSCRNPPFCSFCPSKAGQRDSGAASTHTNLRAVIFR